MDDSWKVLKIKVLFYIEDYNVCKEIKDFFYIICWF